jgi:hypothetical protein
LLPILLILLAGPKHDRLERGLDVDMSTQLRPGFHRLGLHGLGLHGLGLHAKVLAIQVGIVLAVVGAVSAAFLGILAHVVEQRSGQRVLGIAQAFALMPEIRAAIDDQDAAATIQPLAESVRQAAGLTFVVVTNRDKIRLSHPVPRADRPAGLDRQPARARRHGVRRQRAWHARAVDSCQGANLSR